MTAVLVLCSFLGWLFYRHWLGALGAVVLAGPLMKLYERYRLQDQRDAAYQELRDVLYVLSSAFAVGAGLKEGMRDCERALRSSYGEESLLAAEAGQIWRAVEEGNASEAWLLQEFARRSGLSELKQVAMIYGLCLRTGGDLPRAMVDTSDAMLRRLRLWQEIQSQTAQKRMEFTVMMAIVPLLLVAVGSTSDYLTPLYGSVSGRILMTAALLGLTATAGWVTAIVEGGRQ